MRVLDLIEFFLHGVETSADELGFLQRVLRLEGVNEVDHNTLVVRITWKREKVNTKKSH